MDFNYATILAIIAVLAILVGVFRKMEKKTRMWTILLALGAGIVAVYAIATPGAIPFLDTTIGGGESLAVGVTSGGTVAGTTLCAVEDTTVTLSAVDAFTDVATGGSHRYRINNGPALTVADAGTLTASPGDTLSVLFYNASAGGSYFSDSKSVTIPCKGTFTFSDDLYQNGTITIDVFNRNGDLIAETGNNQSLSAGDTFTLNARLTGTYQRGFPQGGVIVAEYNSTEIDDVIVNFGGQKTSTPDFYTSSAVDRTSRTYTVPALLSNAELDGSVYVDVDDTVNPTGTSVITLTFYPNNYYINEDNGGAYAGPAVEDEDGTQTYDHSTAFTIYNT